MVGFCHWQIPTMVGICHGGNVLGNHHDGGNDDRDDYNDIDDDDDCNDHDDSDDDGDESVK